MFEYSPEPSTRGIVHRPVAYVYLQSKDGTWYLFCPYVDSGADTSLFPKGDSVWGLDVAALCHRASDSDEYRFGFHSFCADWFFHVVNSHNTIRNFKACKKDKYQIIGQW